MSNSTENIFQTGYVLNDKWVIIEFIDKGAMGEVYRAHQLNLKRDVAIKVISQEMLQSFGDGPEEIGTVFQRFRREVEAMAQVRHPNVLQIFDYGSEKIIQDGKDVPVEYIVMEYIPGATLRFTMSEEGFYPEHDLIATWLVDYFLPLLDGVEAIHAKGIIHRDLKPENVLLYDVTPKIADFGLAGSLRMKPVTQSIEVRGTPAYMSPEHYFDFKKADRQSDIYSLGKILYESIDGKVTSKTIPFKSVALSNPDTPFLQKLDQIIQEATAEEKEKRPEDVDELRKALLEAIDILKSGSGPDAVVTPGRFTFLNQPRFIWTGIAVAILSMVLMGLWHILVEPGKTTVPQKSSQVTRMESTQRTTSTPFSAESTTPAQSILGQDGITMLFIPGGAFEPGPKVLNVQRQAVQIQSFYLDEKMVTNHHFAEFLNEVKESLTVENGVVKNKSQIWFYLGKGTEQHEQIIYEHARFHLRDTEYAAHPVVRVTWYGASAYAYHYAKRIVTEYEWDYVVSKKDYRSKIFQAKKTYTLPKDAEEASVKNETYTHMMHMDAQHGSKATDVNPASKQSTTDDTRANISAEKLVGQKDMIEDLNEWVMRGDTDQGNRNKAGINGDISYSSLVVGKPLRSGSETKNFRYPWEAFPDVGFRCALSL